MLKTMALAAAAVRRPAAVFAAVLVMLGIAGCGAPGAAGQEEAPKAAVKPADNGSLIAVTDQASKKIVVLDPAVSDWSSEEAVKWSWQPDSSNGFNTVTPGWGLPSGVKLRNNEAFGGQWMVVTDSNGLAAIIPYPAGNTRKWAQLVGGNPHEAELLPNGNIAIAASTGGWVRVYTSSQGPASSKYAQFPLKTAHSVLWDPQREVLWALGHDSLVALRVEGTADAPELRESSKTALPSADGHELQPVYGNPDRLWVTTGSAVYQYVKSDGTWSKGFPDAVRISRKAVKSIGTGSTGQVALTTPKAGCVNSWCTDSVQFVAPDMVRTRAGAAIYKARVWNAAYQ
jgi:hypothetical protein